MPVVKNTMTAGIHHPVVSSFVRREVRPSDQGQKKAAANVTYWFVLTAQKFLNLSAVNGKPPTKSRKRSGCWEFKSTMKRLYSSYAARYLQN